MARTIVRKSTITAAVIVLVSVLGEWWFLSRRVHCRIGNFNIAMVDEMHCPGIGVLTKEPGEEADFHTFGYTDSSADEQVTQATRFPIASLSKQFTGFAVAMLEERGLLRRDTSLKEYLPAFNKPQVTIEHLLYHTSGIPDYTWLCDGSRTLLNKNVFAYAVQEPLDFEPGTTFEYGNTGYVLLGLVIESVTGMPLPDWMEQNLFGPLGMTDTAFFEPEENYLVEAIPHPRDAKTGCDQIRGDGGIVTSLRDFYRWIHELEQPTLIKATSRDRLFTPGKTRNGKSTHYGYGWIVSSDEIFHEGSWGGMESLAIFDREYQTWNAAFTNTTLYNINKIVDVLWLQQSDE